jgi:transcriptional regulator with XRE-family HTH domain
MPAPSTPAALLREARTRAGLSQRELARRAGTTQSVVARIERGQTSPTWETLQRLLAAAGTRLSPRTEPADGSMLYEVPGLLRLTPEQRLQVVEGVSDFRYSARRVSDGSRVPGATIPLNMELLFTTLARHRVQFVLIGALGATLYGFPRVTWDADITPARDAENLRRLAAALRDLDARVFTEDVPEGLPFDCSPQMLARADIWNLITKAGRLDLAFEPAGTQGFPDLAAHAVRFDVYGHTLLVARLEDIIRSKAAAGRPKDRQDVAVMREMLKARKGA